MRTVGIWASGLLASTIPLIFVGAVIVFSACVFDAQGEYTPPARSRASFQEEAAPPQQALAVATAIAPDDVAQRQPGKRKHAHGAADAPRHQHPPPRRSCFHFREKYSPFAFGFGRLRAFANQWDRARVQRKYRAEYRGEFATMAIVRTDWVSNSPTER
jgi:hypothetical protein